MAVVGALRVPLVAGPWKFRCCVLEGLAGPRDIPFELASPSPSADMLPLRLRLVPRESVRELIAGKLGKL